MKKNTLLSIFLSLFSLVSGICFSPQAWSEEDPILVGHISWVEGDLFRYVPEESDWVPTVKDAPFGKGDTLYSDKNGKAEILMSNGTWVRMAGETQLELTELRDEMTEVYLSAGMARIFNRSSAASVRVTTLYGFVTAPAEATIDVYVGNDSVEIIALRGAAQFVHVGDQTPYEVKAGSVSVVADTGQVRAGEGLAEEAWNRWNKERDALWARREQERSESIGYLPPSLYDEAYVLENEGVWDRVYYEGAYQHFWRPVHVGWGWSPFTVGRWTMWCGDQTWIPGEPFGYVTHHYGNWVFVKNYWYWAPPVRHYHGHRVVSPRGIPFAWYPGRVAWIHSYDHIGWVPLAPYEPYYCHRSWGPHTVVVNNVNVSTLNLNRNGYRYFDHAVVVNRNNLYSVNNYQSVRMRNTNQSVINSYRVAPVLSDTVVKDFTGSRDQYNFTALGTSSRPSPAVTDRMMQRRPVASPALYGGGSTSDRNISTGMQRPPLEGEKGTSPQVNNAPSPGAPMNRPASGTTYQGREMRGSSALPSDGPENNRSEVKQGEVPTSSQPSPIPPVKPDSQTIPSAPYKTEVPAVYTTPAPDRRDLSIRQRSRSEGGQASAPQLHNAPVPAMNKPGVEMRDLQSGAGGSGTFPSDGPGDRRNEVKQGGVALPPPPVTVAPVRPDIQRVPPTPPASYSKGDAPGVPPSASPPTHPSGGSQSMRSGRELRTLGDQRQPQSSQRGDRDVNGDTEQGINRGGMSKPPGFSPAPQNFINSPGGYNAPPSGSGYQGRRSGNSSGMYYPSGH